MRQKLLLHICCAPCALHPIVSLQEAFDLKLLFYGPNIHPYEEYKKRLEAGQYIAHHFSIPLQHLAYEAEKWHEAIRGWEEEPEGGRRCQICYRLRLERTAQCAKEQGYGYFGITLTTSPYKKATVINPIGKQVAEAFGLSFWDADFKKKGGFQQTQQLSKQFNIYRQHYCGCCYSRRR